MTLISKRQAPKIPRRRKKARSRLTFTTLKYVLRTSWRSLEGIMKAVWALPPLVRLGMISTLLILFLFGINWSYHTLKKPSEILFPLDHSLNKHPMETWKEYESLFREHATGIITPEFLAALAQVEAAGNPLARTYWRWQRSWNPLEWYRPASSAVGMLQITNGTFIEAKRYCIHDHVVVEAGAWHDFESCWFNSLYTRIVPSHAIELTAALLDRQVTESLGTRRLKTTTLQQRQDLAAIIHLCGAGAGRAYIKRGLQLRPHQRCGDHNLSAYLARIKALKRRFVKPATKNEIIRTSQ